MSLRGYQLFVDLSLLVQLSMLMPDVLMLDVLMPDVLMLDVLMPTMLMPAMLVPNMLMRMIEFARMARFTEAHIDPMCRGDHQPSEGGNPRMKRLDKLGMGIVTKKIEEKEESTRGHHHQSVPFAMVTPRTSQADRTNRYRDPDHRQFKEAIRQKTEPDCRKDAQEKRGRRAMNCTERRGREAEAVEQWAIWSNGGSHWGCWNWF